MNSRVVKLLTLLADGEAYKISQIAESFGVSPRLVRYEIGEASAFLYNEGLPAITAGRTEGISLKLSREQREQLGESLSELDSYNYALRPEERRKFILINLIAANEDYLTSRFFADSLSVSKSCIDKDIAVLKQELQEDYGFSIDSKTGSGIRLIGDERQIRSLCLNTVERIADFSRYLIGKGQNHDFVERAACALFLDEWAADLIGSVRELEQRLNKRFSYNSLRDIVFYLSIALTRIAGGKYISLSEDNLSLMKSTKEFACASELAGAAARLSGFRLDDSETCMIAVMLVSAKYTIQEPHINEDWAQIQVLTDVIVQKMGDMLDFNFVEDDRLYNALQLHLEPMVFKLKNHVPVVNPSLSVIKSNYREVFDALSRVIRSLDTDLLDGISEDDIAYLSLHFCASMERKKRYQPICRIAIVCVHGIGTASLMKELVCSRFSNIRVVATITSSDLSSAELPNVDFIVTSIRIDRSELPCVQVNAIPTEEDFHRIEQMVQRFSGKESFTDDSLTFFIDILNTVERYCTISAAEEFTAALSDCFLRMGLVVKLDKIQPSLFDLVSEKTIRVGASAGGWEQAVRLAGGLIVSDGGATEEFVESLVDTVRAAGPYIVISKGVALAHGKVGVGILKPGMSLVTLKTPVSFGHPHTLPCRRRQLHPCARTAGIYRFA